MKHRCYGCMEEYEQKYEVCPFCGYIAGAKAEEAYHLEPGTEMCGRYLIGRVLGFGGFGITYIGYDKVLAQKVAIKEYLPSECSTRALEQTQVIVFQGEKEEQFKTGMSQFVDEARRLAKLQNVTGIVNIFDTFTENGTAYIVMEYLEGESLKKIIEREGKLSAGRVAEYITPVLEALEEVHKTGILHRDIAPDNIFVTKDGKVKLLDFGAARFASTNKSKSLSVILKPGYSPEEQYRSRGDQGPWTDVYAVAATFYRALTGITPPEAMERAEKDTLKMPHKLGVKIEPSMENALLNALNVKIEERTQSATAFLEELRSEKVLRRTGTVRKTDIGRWPKGLKIAAVFGLLAVIGVTGVLLTDIVPNSVQSWKSVDIPEGKVRVSNIVNMDVDAAIELIEQGELEIEIVDKQYSDVIPEGKILSQTLEAGLIVDAMSKIEVVVSGGQEMAYMIDLSDYMLEDAVKLLEELHIVNYETKEVDGNAAPGAISGQSVAAGEYIPTKTNIVLEVSKGSEVDSTKKSEVPNLVGMLFEDAKALLWEKGLFIVKKDTTNESAEPEGKIMAQEQMEGEELTGGSLVYATVNEGYKKILMPDVQYKEESEAVETLKSKTLKVSVEYEENDNVKEGCVISQSIDAGSEADVGAEVLLKICKNTIIIDWTEDASLVNDKKFTHETKTQYRTQTRTVYSESTSSSSSSMAGWNLTGSSTIEGDWGAWSGWSTNAVSASSTREVETKSGEEWYDTNTGQFKSKTLYRYRDRTVSTVYYFSRNSYSEWSAWSAWTETPATASDLCNVETRTLYKYTSK